MSKIQFEDNFNTGVRRRSSRATGRYQDFIVPVYVNSLSCKALRDSGSAVSIVRRDVLKGVIEFTGENMNLTDAFGRSISIPIAKVKIRSQKFGNNVEFESEVGVSEILK